MLNWIKSKFPRSTMSVIVLRDISFYTPEEIEQLSPLEFKCWVREFHSQEFVEHAGVRSVLDGKEFILVPDAGMDGGLGMPVIEHTFNLKRVQSVVKTTFYKLHQFEKIDENKEAMIVFAPMALGSSSGYEIRVF